MAAQRRPGQGPALDEIHTRTRAAAGMPFKREVCRVGPREANDFARIVAAGFDLVGQAQSLIAGLVEASNRHLFMTFADGTPDGTGAMSVRDGIAYFNWAATDPGLRRRGSQTRLLCQRIQEAGRMGCRLLVTETGEAVPGDPQHAYHNIQRVGFWECFLRENWSPARGQS